MEFADVVRRRRMERIVASAQRAPSVAGDGFDPAQEPTV
jgi:hypothetical protein